jgi:hypothetical protein
LLLAWDNHNLFRLSRSLDPMEAIMPLLDNAGTETCVSYHPNDKLAEIIARAWSNSEYRDRLLNDTANQLKQAGIFVDNPIVVTEKDFKKKGFQKDQHTVFVLPDPPSDKHFEMSTIQGNLIETARVKMAYTCCGI